MSQTQWKHVPRQSRPLSFQDISYKIPEQSDSWSRYVLKEVKDLEHTRGETGEQSPLLFYGFLHSKNISSQNTGSLNLHEEQDTK